MSTALGDERVWTCCFGRGVANGRYPFHDPVADRRALSSEERSR